MSKDLVGYLVTLVSKDNQRYVYKSEKIIEEDAINEAKQSIINKHWDSFNHILDTIRPILKGELQYGK